MRGTERFRPRGEKSTRGRAERAEAKPVLGKAAVNAIASTPVRPSSGRAVPRGRPRALASKVHGGMERTKWM